MPSVFNTGQILFGMHSLYAFTGDQKWLTAGEKAAKQLAEDINQKGLWESGHYNNFNPTYYTRVAWPMLLIAKDANNPKIESKALLVLDQMISRLNPNGAFDGWGFSLNKPAFTHTIAYTLRGFIESSILIEDWGRYGVPVEKSLEKLYRLSELTSGRLSGAYGIDWKPHGKYSCLTGNAQIAICLLRWHELQNDLRLVNAASKLLEFVYESQIKSGLWETGKGAIAGSSPIWGRYMVFRYPNWAAKFYADGLMLLLEILKKEKSTGNK